MYLGENVHVRFEYSVFQSSVGNGITKAYATVVDEDGVPITDSQGCALCSCADNYNKVVGRKIALGRALLELFPDNKSKRSRVWKAFKEKCKVA